MNPQTPPTPGHRLRFIFVAFDRARNPAGIIRGCLNRLGSVRKTKAVLGLSIILCTPPLLADPLDTWEVRHPLPEGNAYFYGDGQWIGLLSRSVVGGSGGIIQSTDAVSWSRSQIPFDFVPWGAAYANGLWVVFGQEGTNGVNLFSAILTSTTGTIWEKQTSGLDLLRSLGIDPQINRVAYGGGLWMAMGRKGQYLISADGVTWTPRAIAGVNQISSLTYGNSRWLALSPLSGASSQAYVSTDGTDWTEHALPFGVTTATFAAGQWTSIAYDSSLGNRLMTSTNGTEWVTRHTGSEIYRLIGYGDGRWLVAGVTSPNMAGFHNLVTLTSTNGSTWVRSVVPPGFRDEFLLDNLCYGQGQWLLSGINGYGVRELLASTNAVDWSSRMERAISDVGDLVYAAGQWIAVGSTWDWGDTLGLHRFGIATSLDGRRWTTGHASGGGRLKAVAYGDGKWMAAGVRYNDPQYFSGVILTSTNGSNWVEAFSGVSRSEFGGIAFGNGLWVAVGANPSGPLLVTSPDGLTWTPRTLPVAEGWFRRVRFANGRWVVLGGSPTEPFMLTSANGVDWSLAAGVAGNGVYVGRDAHFAEGTWIALASRTHPDGLRRPTTLRSINGTDWVVHDLDTPITESHAITHVAGRWIIGGNTGGNTAVWSSGDGEHWTEHLAASSFAAVASDGRHLLMASEDVIQASGRLPPALPPVLALTRQGAELSLWLSGELGEQYGIEQSSDLGATGWSPLQDVILTTNPQEIPLGAPTGNQGFWRARSP